MALDGIGYPLMYLTPHCYSPMYWANGLQLMVACAKDTVDDASSRHRIAFAAFAGTSGAPLSHQSERVATVWWATSKFSLG